MSEKGVSKNILKRDFMELKEKSLVKKLNVNINGTNLNELLFGRIRYSRGNTAAIVAIALEAQ